MPKLQREVPPRKSLSRAEILALKEKAGFWGLAVYRELLQLSQDYDLKGRLHRQLLGPGYLAQRLQWTGRTACVSRGLKAAVAAGLATWESETLLRVSLERAFDVQHGCSRGAFRQRKLRERRANSKNERYAGVTRALHGRYGLTDPPAPREHQSASTEVGDGLAPFAATAALPLGPLSVVRRQETPEDLQQLWSAKADSSLPRWREMPPKRRQQATKALRERPLREWDNIVQAVNKSPFLLGSNKTGWRADLDWLLKPGRASRVLEGAYQAKQQAGTERNRGIATHHAPEGLVANEF